MNQSGERKQGIPLQANEVSPNIIHMTWEGFRELADQLVDGVKTSEYHPEIVVGILRGGRYPAEYVAHALGVPTASIRVKRTTSNAVFSEKLPPIVVDEESTYQDAVAGKRVLLVDDIATFGETLTLASGKLLVAGATKVQRAILIGHRPERLQGETIEFQSRSCEPEDWFVFPWEEGEDYS